MPRSPRPQAQRPALLCLLPGQRFLPVGQGVAARRQARLRHGDPRAALSSALLAHTLEHALAAVFLEAGVQSSDLQEDLVSHGLLLLARRIRDPLPANRVSVLHGGLGKLQALPVANARRTVNRDRHYRRARLERQAADAALGLLGHFARARAPALAIHRDRSTPREDRLGGDEDLFVAGPATNRKDASVGVDEL